MLALLLLPLLAAAAIIILVLLNYKKIIGWFQGKQALKESDKANIAFTMQEKLKSGNYKTVQGVFNKRSNEVVDGTIYESEDICSDLKEIHRKDQVAIYN